MNMQTLYDEMKEALAYFGLKFHQMGEVEVRISDCEIIFSHGIRHIAITCKKEN